MNLEKFNSAIKLYKIEDLDLEDISYQDLWKVCKYEDEFYDEDRCVPRITELRNMYFSENDASIMSDLINYPEILDPEFMLEMITEAKNGANYAFSHQLVVSLLTVFHLMNYSIGLLKIRIICKFRPNYYLPSKKI
jgi:hypothetical protein